MKGCRRGRSVSNSCATVVQSGKVQFGYIYGVGVTGSLGMYLLVHLMSETGFNFFSTVSVLGYCLLPMDILALVSVASPLLCVLSYPSMVLQL